MIDLDELRTELARAEDAELESESQLRQMVALIADTSKPESARSASDCHKLVSAALDLNTRLKAHTEHLRKQIKMLENPIRLPGRAMTTGSSAGTST